MEYAEINVRSCVVMRRPLVERSATARSGPLQSDRPVEHPLLVADSKDLQLVQLPIRRYGYIRLADLSGHTLVVHEDIGHDGLLGDGAGDGGASGERGCHTTGGEDEGEGEQDENAWHVGGLRWVLILRGM